MRPVDDYILGATLFGMETAMKTILLVDNEFTNLFSISDTLAILGYGTIAVQDGPTALSIIEEGMPVDLAMVAECLGSMECLELLGHFKNRFPSIPTIMLAESCSIESYLKARSQGAVEYLCKPVKFNDLKRIVQDVIEIGHEFDDLHALHRGAMLQQTA